MATGDPGLTLEDSAALQAHLSTCRACRVEYQRCRQSLGTIQKYAGIGPDTIQLLESHGETVRGHLRPVPEKLSEIPDAHVEAGLARLMAQIDHPDRTQAHRPMSLEEGVADLRRRVNTIEAYQIELREDSEHLAGRQNPVASPGGWPRKLRLVTGIAACLTAAAVLGWMSLSPPERINLIEVNSDDAVPLIEWVTALGMQPIPVGEPIHSGDQRRELLLGGAHRVVLNTETTATVFAQDGVFNIGLAQGELYVEVVPGISHGFEVTTSNAHLTITGTKFSVKADDQQTELTLLKGSVRLASLEGNSSVDVLAGNASRVYRLDAPTRPQPVNAFAATAWARQTAIDHATARIDPSPTHAELNGLLEDSLAYNMPEYRARTYERFRHEQRPWFAKHFPWAMSLETKLQEDHGLKADYLDILVVSGDIWQFRYTGPNRPTGKPLTAFHPASVKRLADWYGLDADTLTRAIGYQPESHHPIETPDGKTFATAIDRWISDLTLADHEQFVGDALNTYELTSYLINTRAAARLWFGEHPEHTARLLDDDNYVYNYFADLFNLTEPGDTNPAVLLAIQLDAQVDAVTRCRQLINEQLTMPVTVAGSNDECILRQERFCNILEIFNKD